VDLLRERFEPVHSAGGKDDLCSLPAELTGSRFPDPRGSASDNDYFTFNIHGSPS
jgi:hypothetical protein